MLKLSVENKQLLIALSKYLNETPDAITINQINKVKDCGVDEIRAFELLLQEYLQIPSTLANAYFKDMIHLLNFEDFMTNPYYKNIHLEFKKDKNWEIKKTKYKPYELFVQDDFIVKDNKMIPNLGFFNKPFYYLAVYQNQHLWMSITPNEINTMKDPIQKSFGRVITFGLGLGYFAYMCSMKQSVQSVTIIEKDATIISLFKKMILPQFLFKEKITIIQADAIDYLSTQMAIDQYDFAFIDIYHDVSDGKEVYLKIKKYESMYKKTQFEYWIEKTIKLYL